MRVQSILRVILVLIDLMTIKFYSESQNVERIRTEAYFGRVHAIALDTVNNRWLGSADPDWEGSVSDFE